MSSRRHYDVVVCGGGVAGAACAGLLARQGRHVALIDRQGPDDTELSDEFDPRVVALSPASAAILAAAGGWAELPKPRLAPYDRMQVHAQNGSIEFKASEHGLEQLGWIAEIPTLQRAQWQALQQTPTSIDLLATEGIEAIDRESLGADRLRLSLTSGKTIRTSLLIAADGGRSQLRQQAGISTDEWHYNQSALVCHVRTRQANPGIAWQRFTDDGPLALLPLPDGRSSIVWSQHQGIARQRQAMDETEFLGLLNRYQDSPFGPASAATARYLLPLIRRRANALVKGRLVLLGDAARTVHPLAGQGLNLGLADAACLTECLEKLDLKHDPARALAAYERRRLSASTLTGGGIHWINELAHSPGPLGRGLLGLGFATAARLWPARDAFVRRACGLDSGSPATGRETRQ